MNLGLVVGAWIVTILIGLAVLAAGSAILAGLLMAFIAVPSFWGAFWLILAALVLLAGVVRPSRK